MYGRRCCKQYVLLTSATAKVIPALGFSMQGNGGEFVYLLPNLLEPTFHSPSTDLHACNNQNTTH